MDNDKKYIRLPCFLAESRLEDEELGRLVLAAFEYASDGTEPKLEGKEAAVWPFLRHDIDDLG